MIWKIITADTAGNTYLLRRDTTEQQTAKTEKHRESIVIKSVISMQKVLGVNLYNTTAYTMSIYGIYRRHIYGVRIYNEYIYAKTAKTPNSKPFYYYNPLTFKVYIFILYIIKIYRNIPYV